MLVSELDLEINMERRDTRGRLDAHETEQRNAKPILRWEVALLMPVVVLYGIARLYMIVEALAGLRELPTAVFKTVDWTEILPLS